MQGRTIGWAGLAFAHPGFQKRKWPRIYEILNFDMHALNRPFKKERPDYSGVR